MSLVRALIVDDEPLARQRLRLLLGRLPNLVEVVGEVDGRTKAAAAVAKLAPDLIFLDVQLRDGTGFDLFDFSSGEGMPLVIFVTGYDTFAIQAFDAGAVDYLLKPVKLDRLRLALERAIGADRGALKERLIRLSSVIDVQRQDGNPKNRTQEEFWVRRASGDLTRVLCSAVDWAVVEDNYVRLHVGTDSYLLRESLRSVSTKLGAAFVRVHRTAVVRLDAIEKVAPAGFGLLDIVLKSGQIIRAGRVYAKHLRRVFREQSAASQSRPV